MLSNVRVFLSLLLLVAAGVPAFAQIDLSGEWFPLAHEDQEVDRRGGAVFGDYSGLAVNEAARRRGDTFDASSFSVPEWQCRPHAADFIASGPSPLRVWKEVNPQTQEVIAWHAHWLRSAVDQMIYMDGRPHPPDIAPHTWEGFSTGKWEGDMLTTRMTHLHEDYLRRNGIFRSDQATVTQHWFLHDNDYLTQVTIITDPAYLTEPHIRSYTYIRYPHQEIPAYPCPVVVEEVRPKGYVPHFLPGTHPYLTELAAERKIPLEAMRGGKETRYPEYQMKLKEMMNAGTK
jgi:hypothetical protein